MKEKSKKLAMILIKKDWMFSIQHITKSIPLTIFGSAQIKQKLKRENM